MTYMCSGCTVLTLRALLWLFYTVPRTAQLAQRVGSSTHTYSATNEGSWLAGGVPAFGSLDVDIIISQAMFAEIDERPE